MKKVVIDSSVAIKWYVPQPYSSQAIQILNDYQAGTIALLAPDLIYAEVGNITWKLYRFQGLSASDAQTIIDAFQLVKFNRVPAASLLKDAYQFAVTYQRSVYDSLYIALSLRQQCQFVTADQKLVNAVSATHPNVISIGNWS
ncbi:type II toxin-antitoxin system VapC family toxin [Coleofasciculus sp. E1-EBD-02]|uniref:type II toxin-antitoxin system VapC family toxin n=1 Tax=Coleofasciculus sp. E1-EBD-02 TaxID=3068481 RepID=UPI0032F9A938